MIVPIINESRVKEVKRKLEMVRGVVERVQIDVADGLFTDHLTIGPKDLLDYDFGEMEVEYHLMVDDPTEWIGECVEAGAKRIIGQIERMGSQGLFVEEVESSGKVGAGLALEYTTPLEAIEREMLVKVKMILLLSIPTGPAGGVWQEGILKKISSLRERYQGEIFIDGGMNPQRYREVLAAGATTAGSSSYLWKDDWEKRLREFSK